MKTKEKKTKGIFNVVGALSNKEAKELRESVKETRRQIQERVEETAKRIK